MRVAPLSSDERNRLDDPSPIRRTFTHSNQLEKVPKVWAKYERRDFLSSEVERPTVAKQT